MNTLQINSCMQTSHSFVGTFSADHLPDDSQLIKPYSFIANTDPSYLPGSHWVAFYVTKKCIEIFDSYGRELCKLFKKFVDGKLHYCNDKQVQQIGTSVCGHYCIYYIHQKEKGLTTGKIMSKFRDLDENDSFVKNWIDERYSCKAARPYSHIVQNCVCLRQ